MDAGNLITFYAARLDEAEQLARMAGQHGGTWKTGCTHGDDCPGSQPCEEVTGDGIRIYAEGGHDAWQAEHIALHNPGHELRVIAAGRSLIRRLRAALAAHDGDSNPLLAALYGQACDEAAAWSDHPGYRGWPAITTGWGAGSGAAPSRLS